jgi:hypothetical protein
MVRGIFFLVLLFLTCIDGISYRECEKSSSSENRILHIATCDTRHGWKEFKALQPWNITGQKVKSDGVQSMKNVCKGGNWGALGFLTKPLTYLAHIRKILSETNPTDVPLLHIILMDSDTFFAVNTMSEVWRHYDCARNGMSAVMSTEMSCWMGRYCKDGTVFTFSMSYLSIL